MTPRWSAIVLSQGNRPGDLGKALDSLLTQDDVSLEVIVVGNGWDPVGLPPGVVTVYLEENVGVPEGRNRGVLAARGDYLYFLDDDARLPEPDTLARLERLFEEDPTLGVVQTRILTPEGESMKRWVPRTRDKDANRTSEVFSVLEGSLAVRATTQQATHNWAGRFFYSHEGIELAWRAWNAGYRVEYHADFTAVHPRVEPNRHPGYAWYQGRNRMWLAKRNLPWPIACVYITNWTLITLLRGVKHAAESRSWLQGAREGLRTDAGTRRPISWRTACTMAKRGRPPLI